MTEARTLPVGVYQRRGGRYYAAIKRWTKAGAHQQHLGSFDTIEEAAEARRLAEETMKGNTSD